MTKRQSTSCPSQTAHLNTHLKQSTAGTLSLCDNAFHEINHKLELRDIVLTLSGPRMTSIKFLPILSIHKSREKVMRIKNVMLLRSLTNSPN